LWTVLLVVDDNFTLPHYGIQPEGQPTITTLAKHSIIRRIAVVNSQVQNS
jgi:hypothetical protein